MRRGDSFENRLILYTCAVISIVMLVATGLNISLKLDNRVSILTGVGSLLFLLFYRLGSTGKYFVFIRYSIGFIMLSAINFGWFFNNGSKGPVLSTLVIYVSFMVFIWERKTVIWLLVLVMLNTILLCLLELSRTFVSADYPTENARIIDYYVGIAVSILLIYLYSAYARRNYLHQYLRAKKSDYLKTAFLANLSHEIRTPLNAIMGFSGLLSSTSDKQKQARFNQIIQNNGKHLTRLIGDLLDISMIESDQISLSPEKISIDDLIVSHTLEVKNLLKEQNKTGIKVNSSIKVETDYILTDLVRLKQILSNLTSNAIKYTNEGSITISVIQTGSLFKFSIKDTGLGIKKDDSKQIFNRFYKVDNETTKLYRGTGLGLYLCKQLVEMLKGSIGFESVYLKGSIFYFTLPLEIIPDEDDVLEPADEM